MRHKRTTNKDWQVILELETILKTQTPKRQ
jgi:hypothetical protein